MAKRMKNNFLSALASLKLTNDCIIEDAHTTITHQEIVEQWHTKICKKIKCKLSVCYNEELFEDVLKDYLRLLKEQASNFKDKKLLKEKILKHLHVFHLYYCSSDEVAINTPNFLDSIESILLIICNLEFEITRHVRKIHFSKQEYNRMVKRISQKMIKYLCVYLENEMRIIHVLLKFDYKYDSQTWKDVMHLVYRHYLINLPVTDFSDEGFCRHYLLFQKLKNITPEPMHTGIDKIMYFRFKKNSNCIRSSPVLRSILLPSANSIADLVDVLADKQQASVNTYFRHLDKKLNEIEAISLDSDEEETPFESKEKRRNGVIKIEKSKTNAVYVIDDDDDDSDEIQIIDTETDNSNLPSLQSAPIKSTTFLESIYLPNVNISEELEEPSTIPGSSTELDTNSSKPQCVVVNNTPALLLTNYLNYMRESNVPSGTSDSPYSSSVSIDCQRVSSEPDEFNRQLEVILNTCDSHKSTASNTAVEAIPNTCDSHKSTATNTAVNVVLDTCDSHKTTASNTAGHVVLDTCDSQESTTSNTVVDVVLDSHESTTLNMIVDVVLDTCDSHENTASNTCDSHESTVSNTAVDVILNTCDSHKSAALNTAMEVVFNSCDSQESTASNMAVDAILNTCDSHKSAVSNIVVDAIQNKCDSHESTASNMAVEVIPNTCNSNTSNVSNIVADAIQNKCDSHESIASNMAVDVILNTYDSHKSAASNMAVEAIHNSCDFQENTVSNTAVEADLNSCDSQESTASNMTVEVILNSCNSNKSNVSNIVVDAIQNKCDSHKSTASNTAVEVILNSCDSNESTASNMAVDAMLSTCDSHESATSNTAVKIKATVIPESENRIRIEEAIEMGTLIDQEVDGHSSIESTLETVSEESFEVCKNESTKSNIYDILTNLGHCPQLDMHRRWESSTSKSKNVESDKMEELFMRNQNIDEDTSTQSSVGTVASVETVSKDSRKNKLIAGIFGKKLPPTTARDDKIDLSVPKKSEITSINEKMKVVAKSKDRFERLSKAKKKSKVITMSKDSEIIAFDPVFGTSKYDREVPKTKHSARVTSRRFSLTQTSREFESDKVDFSRKGKDKVRSTIKKINRAVPVIETNKTSNKIFVKVNKHNHFDSIDEETEMDVAKDKISALKTVPVVHKTKKIGVTNSRVLRQENKKDVIVSEVEKSNKILEQLAKFSLETEKSSSNVFEVKKHSKKEKIKKKSKSRKSKRSHRNERRFSDVTDITDCASRENDELLNRVNVAKFDTVNNSVKVSTAGETLRDGDNFSFLSNLYTPPSSNRTAGESSPEPSTNDNTYSFMSNLSSKGNYDTLTPRSETFSETSNQGESNCDNIEIENVEEVIVDNVPYVDDVDFNRRKEDGCFGNLSSQEAECNSSLTRVLDDDFKTNECFEQADPGDPSVTDDYTVATEFSECPDSSPTSNRKLANLRILECKNIETEDLVNELEAVINPVDTAVENPRVEISNGALSKNCNILYRDGEVLDVRNSKRKDRSYSNLSEKKLSLGKSCSVSERNGATKALRNLNFNAEKTESLSVITNHLIDERLNKLTLKAEAAKKKKKLTSVDLAAPSKETMSAPLSIFEKFQQDQSNKLLQKPLQSDLKNTERRNSGSSNENFCVFDSDKLSNVVTTIVSPPYEHIPAKEYENHIRNMSLENLEPQESVTSPIVRDINEKNSNELKNKETSSELKNGETSSKLQNEEKLSSTKKIHFNSLIHEESSSKLQNEEKLTPTKQIHFNSLINETSSKLQNEKKLTPTKKIHLNSLINEETISKLQNEEKLTPTKKMHFNSLINEETISKLQNEEKLTPTKEIHLNSLINKETSSKLQNEEKLTPTKEIHLNSLINEETSSKLQNEEKLTPSKKIHFNSLINEETTRKLQNEEKLASAHIEKKLNNVVPPFSCRDNNSIRNPIIIYDSTNKRQCSDGGNQTKKQKVNFGPTEIRFIHNEPYSLIDEDVVSRACESMEKYSIKRDDQKLIFMEPQILIHLKSPSELVVPMDPVEPVVPVKPMPRRKRYVKIIRKDEQVKQSDNSCILKRVDYAKPSEDISTRINDAIHSETSNLPTISSVAGSSNYISAGSDINPRRSYPNLKSMLHDWVQNFKSTNHRSRSPTSTSKRRRGRPRTHPRNY